MIEQARRRLDTLDRPSRLILGMAARCGRRFRADELAAGLGRPRLEILAVEFGFHGVLYANNTQAFGEIEALLRLP